MPVLCRVLMPMAKASNSSEARAGVSLARTLLTVTPIQTAVANVLLEKLPEHIGDDAGSTLPALMDSIPRYHNNSSIPNWHVMVFLQSP